MKDWAIILGGSSGIGLASAKKLAHEGFNICIVHRNRRSDMPQIEEEFANIRKAGVQCLNFNKDALQEDSQIHVCNALQEKLNEGKVRLLLHSIARGNLKKMAPYRDLSPESELMSKSKSYLRQQFSEKEHFLKRDDFLLTIDSMAISFYSWTRLLFERDLFAKNALTLTLSSEGSSKAWHNYAAVSAAKAALEAISRSMALEFAPHGIRCNVLQPGVTDTKSLNMIKGNELLKDQARFRNPFGRLTTVEDVANVVYLLTRVEANWINGAIIPVDGGESIC